VSQSRPATRRACFDAAFSGLLPLDVALQMGAPFLVERGIEPSEEGLGPALIMRLLLDLPANDGYFRPLADQPTMAQALWSTIRELRMSGVTSSDLECAAFASHAKRVELTTQVGGCESRTPFGRRQSGLTIESDGATVCRFD
jgi:hypothetical protein